MATSPLSNVTVPQSCSDDGEDETPKQSKLDADLQFRIKRLISRLKEIPGFNHVTFCSSVQRAEHRRCFMLNKYGVKRYAGSMASVLLGRFNEGKSHVRYDPMFDTVFIVPEERTWGDWPEQNKSTAAVRDLEGLYDLGANILQFRRMRGTKTFSMTHYGLRSNHVTCADRKAYLDPLVAEWTALKARDPDCTLFDETSPLAFRYQQLYNSLNMVDTREDFEQLIVETKALSYDYKKLLSRALECHPRQEQEVEEITRSSLASDSATTVPISHLY